jgi:hypothetical protein
MMKILIDGLIHQATFLTSTTEYGDERRYYEIGQVLIVCRNGLNLQSLIRRIVDAQVGWDTAMAGFTVDEGQIGQRRTKITIYRVVNSRYDVRLNELIRRGE